MVEQQVGRKTIEALRRKLQAKEQELRAAISRHAREGRQPDDLGTQDLADQATVCYSKEERFQHGSHNRELLALVQAALRRTEDGDFGLCTSCQAPVEKKRLEVMPWAEYCVGCQQLQEKGLL
ncbi:MAG: TraR/DksA family transcriptional regulator [Acidobacteria bacterium]|nr:TraR/DksA family transcriptional regulator [Acidobacteriota bacterium]MBI3471202.1 TraR/DksA family transcriptional regulator [Candidatus Solibacter usitatus]